MGLRWRAGSAIVAGSALVSMGNGQTPAPGPGAPPSAAIAAPMQDLQTLLEQVERNQKRMEALQRDYTYHVHTEEVELDRTGNTKKTETVDAESLTLDGVRVNRVVARNGVPLTGKEADKESARLDDDVRKAKERRSKLAEKGSETDARGDPVLPLSRILELGSFLNPRREQVDGRPVVVVDYAGNPQAKTHTPFEGIVRDMVGTLWIDADDRVLVRAQGHFVNDFKLGGGLVADVGRGTHFAFRATRLGNGVWLPATVDGEGSVRVLLFAHFHGRLHLVTSDYRRFHSSAVIVGSHGAIGADGTPLDPSTSDPPTHPASEELPPGKPPSR